MVLPLINSSSASCTASYSSFSNLTTNLTTKLTASPGPRLLRFPQLHPQGYERRISSGSTESTTLKKRTCRNSSSPVAPLLKKQKVHHTRRTSIQCNTPKKAARFAADTELETVITKPRSLTREELPLTWYQKEDYACIKLGIIHSIHAIAGVFSSATLGELDLDKHCLRGIETGISPDLYQQRKRRIQSTLSKVLEQQRALKTLGLTVDPQVLRNASLEASKEAQESAAAVGRLDYEAQQV